MHTTLVLALFSSLALAGPSLNGSFSVREASLVFVDPVVEAPTSPEAAEGGADMAFYRDAATTFAKRNSLQVHTTKAATILFERMGSKPYRLKNTVGPMGEAYFFDGTKDPKKVDELVTLTDGREFKAYFGRPARAK